MRTLTKDKIKINDEDYSLKYGTIDDFDELITDNCLVFDKSTGTLVAALCKQAIAPQTAKLSYQALMKGFGYTTDNRGAYAATEREQDYKKSKNSRTHEVRSFAGGYFERQGGRNPYCRATQYTRHKPKAWKQNLLLLKEMAAVMEQHAFDKYTNQMSFVSKIHSDYTYDGLPFTTTAVNISTRAGYHRDKGDYKGGIGCMSVFKKGLCINWKLVLPEYKIALDIGDRDVILFDPHLLHATTKGTGIGKMYKDWNRISVVAYVRQRLINCRSIQEEIDNARRTLKQ